MPIYEYRCAACGFQKEYLQKMSDPLLTDCPECGKATFGKMVTAAGFQLKGSGWYVTDFKQGAKPASGVAAKAGATTDAKSEGTTAPATTGDSKPAADAPAKKTESTPATAAAATTAKTGSTTTGNS